MGLRSLASCDCGFEYRRWHGCLSLVSVVCCQGEVYATCRSFVQSSSTERKRERESVCLCVCVCVCVIECYQMQQSTSTSTRVDRGGQTKKGRKIKASLVRPNRLEQAMMLLICIWIVVIWNQNCSTDCASRRSSQRFWVPRGKCGENSCHKANVLKNI